MCVVTANHEVVGLVTEAGPDYAVIKTILDSSLEVSATIASSGYSGMVKGGYTDGRKDMMRMDYLPSSAIIKNKDQVVTSGSTVYPRGLILGHVVDADFDDTGVAKYAILRPAADFDVLEQVFILTEYTTNAE
jgi:rod shape-determining protein MreC